MPQVLTIGEALIGFLATPAGVTLRQAAAFERAALGAPACIAAGLARLGVSAGFISRVGDDPFGYFLADTLASEGVDVGQVGFESRARTGLAFITTIEKREQEIAWFRHPSADMYLSPGHINPSYVKQTQAILFSSSGLIAEPCRSGVFKALAIARDAGILRVFDVNLHSTLWGSASEARYGLRLGLDRADLVQLNQSELELLSDTRDPETGTHILWTQNFQQGHQPRLVTVRLDAGGCAYRTASHFGRLPGYRVLALDSNGASESFASGLLAKLIDTDLSLALEDIQDALHFANAASALATTQLGLIPALPTRSQVESFLADAPRPT